MPMPARAPKLGLSNFGASAMGRRQAHGNRVAELVERLVTGAGRHTDEVPVALGERRRASRNDGSQAPANPIPLHRIPDRATHGVRHLRWVPVLESGLTDPHRAVAAWSGARQLGECRTAANSVNQAESLARPRLRRDLSTARPARLRIRSRKPCFFLRFRLLGWKVRFTHGLLEEGIAPKGPSEEGLRHVGRGGAAGA